MAKEITVTGFLGFAKGSISSITMQKTGMQFDVGTNSNNYQRGTQSIPTSKTAINLGSIQTAGWMYVQNNDSTNYVDLYASTSAVNPLIRLKPGEFCCGRLAASAPAAKANTASVVIEYIVVQDDTTTTTTSTTTTTTSTTTTTTS